MKTKDESSFAVIALLESFNRRLDERTWVSGQKLPTERELVIQFGASRNTLRRGLKKLEEEGKIVRHVGRGSFVASPLQQAVVHRDGDERSRGSLAELARGSSPSEIMEVRLMIEPAAAALAAYRANAEDLRQMRGYLADAERAVDGSAFEHSDALLHVAIVRAARNHLLEGIYAAINAARVQPEWKALKERSLTFDQRVHYHQTHIALVEALHARDPEKARSIAIEHLGAVNFDLFGER